MKTMTESEIKSALVLRLSKYDREKLTPKLIEKIKEDLAEWSGETFISPIEQLEINVTFDQEKSILNVSFQNLDTGSAESGNGLNRMRKCYLCSAKVDTKRGRPVCQNCRTKPKKYSELSIDRKNKILDRSKKWAKNNPEKIKAKDKAWRDKNRQKVTEYNREYKRKWRADRKAKGINP